MIRSAPLRLLYNFEERRSIDQLRLRLDSQALRPPNKIVQERIRPFLGRGIQIICLFAGPVGPIERMEEEHLRPKLLGHRIGVIHHKIRKVGKVGWDHYDFFIKSSIGYPSVAAALIVGR